MTKRRIDTSDIPEAGEAFFKSAKLVRPKNTDPCVCGHAIEEHGHDRKHPGSMACTECDCIAYEADRQVEKPRRAPDRNLRRAR